jgi:hypothetical protein
MAYPGLCNPLAIASETGSMHVKSPLQTARRWQAIARKLRDRLHRFAWWWALMARYPGGLVTVPTAAWMLGVKRARIYKLMDEGKLPAVNRDRSLPGVPILIPAAALLAAPSAAETGRPLNIQRNPGDDRDGPFVNPWCLDPRTGTTGGNPADFLVDLLKPGTTPRTQAANARKQATCDASAGVENLQGPIMADTKHKRT